MDSPKATEPFTAPKSLVLMSHFLQKPSFSFVKKLRKIVIKKQLSKLWMKFLMGHWFICGVYLSEISRNRFLAKSLV